VGVEVVVMVTSVPGTRFAGLLSKAMLVWALGGGGPIANAGIAMAVKAVQINVFNVVFI
jgi:hypothetical protein